MTQWKKTKEISHVKKRLIMLSILNLKHEAYLIAIVDHLSKITGKTVLGHLGLFPFGQAGENGVDRIILRRSDFGARRPQEKRSTRSQIRDSFI